jgi:hypothetical protein
LSVAVGAWSATRAPGNRLRLKAVLAAVAAPVLWLAWDLALTGDPLFSLRGTQQLADQLDRPRSVQLAPLLAGPSIRLVLGLPLGAAGLVGVVVLARRGGDRARLVIGVLLAALVSFGVLGLAGLPLLARYLLVPATLLAVCAAAAAADWRTRPVLAALVGVLLLAAVPGTVTGLQSAVHDGRTRRATQATLRALLSTQTFRRVRRGCSGVTVSSYLLRPEVARHAGLPPSAVGGGFHLGAALVLPASGRAAESLIAPGNHNPPIIAVPAHATLLTVRGGDWVLAGSCQALAAAPERTYIGRR